MELNGELHTHAAFSLHPLVRRMDGLYSRSGRCKGETNLLPLSGIEPNPSSPQGKPKTSPILVTVITRKSYNMMTNTPASFYRKKDATSLTTREFDKAIQLLGVDRDLNPMARIVTYRLFVKVRRSTRLHHHLQNAIVILSL
jgi:hypothetical protein